MSPAMSGGLSESENYIWNPQCDADYLGEGCFGKVFRGVHRRTGSKVAVKIFKNVTQDVWQEYKMLQKLKHQYIIQLIGIEFEQCSGNAVMIMELCNGGSLLNYLNEPENAFGLLDSEFLLVLEHLSGGLEYLKRHNVIHRDVKPGNIMRHVMNDGRTIYKLADFGTARELPEGENFNSLHGTEPYLNPKMFKVCFFRNDESTREFGANVDLWSIGVTLYHIATGSLPFMAEDRHVMLRIFNEMKHDKDIISAVQKRNSEEVFLQKKLPSNCRLSSGLKQLITPIIAGLFRQNDDEQWSFAQYYENVLDLTSRTVINVFYINSMQMLNIYIKKDQTFVDFKYYVFVQSGVTEENQVFLYKKNLIVNNFEDFPYLEADCVFLFDRTGITVESTRNVPLFVENLSNFPTKFMSESDGDIRFVFTACRDLNVLKNHMDYQSTVYKYFCIFIKDFNSYCKNARNELQTVYDMILEKYSDTDSRVRILDKLQELTNSSHSDILEDFEIKTNSFIEQCSRLFDDLNGLKTEAHFNTSHDSYLRIVTKELSDIKFLSKNLYGLRINKKLYNYEKIKILHCVQTIMEIFKNKVDPNFEHFVDDMKNWYRDTFFSQVRNLRSLKKFLHNYKIDLKKYEEEISLQSESNLGKISGNQSIPCKQKLKELFAKYKQNNFDIKSIIEENVKLTKEMNELIQHLDEDVAVTDL